MTKVFEIEREVKRAPNPNKAGWRINEWGPAVGIGRSQVCELIAAGAIDSVKLGAARIIVTSPTDFLASLASKAV